MLIKLADLPLDLSKKIPMTLKLNRTQIETDYLPRQLAHDIEMYLDSFTNFDVFVPDKVRDLIPELSIYNDLKCLTTTKEAILEYLKNYLSVSKGDYFFIPNFGCDLKKYIHEKNDSLKETYVNNELGMVVNLLSNEFELPITIVSSDLYVKNNGIAVEYFLMVSIKIDGELQQVQVQY